MSLVKLPQNAVALIGILVEKLGGVVTFTEAEMRNSLIANGGTLYVEVDVGGNGLTIEVFPRGFSDAKH